LPHSTTVASRCQSSFGLLAASHRSFVRSCRGGSRSCSAISPSPAGRGGHAVEPSRRRRSNARRHRADACARSSRQVSARFRRTAGRTHHFPPAPLHFTAISQATFPFHSFRRPQTAETVKDSGAPKDSRGRDAPHIGQDRQYGRATSSGKKISITARGSACRRRQSNSTARLRPVQDAAITVRSAISAPPPFRKLHCSGQKPPNSLVKPNWSDTTAAGYGQVCRARPCCHRVAAHALRSAVVESENLAGAGATAPGNATRRDVAGFAAALA